jgi:hypothetical protein
VVGAAIAHKGSVVERARGKAETLVLWKRRGLGVGGGGADLTLADVAVHCRWGKEAKAANEVEAVRGHATRERVRERGVLLTITK